MATATAWLDFHFTENLKPHFCLTFFSCWVYLLSNGLILICIFFFFFLRSSRLTVDWTKANASVSLPFLMNVDGGYLEHWHWGGCFPDSGCGQELKDKVSLLSNISEMCAHYSQSSLLVSFVFEFADIFIVMFCFFEGACGEGDLHREPLAAPPAAGSVPTRRRSHRTGDPQFTGTDRYRNMFHGKTLPTIWNNMHVCFCLLF